MNGVELILDADGDTSITADTDDQIDIKIGTDQFSFKDGVIEPTTNNDVDLGNETGPKRFKDVNIAGTIRVAGIPQGKDVTAALNTKILDIGDWDMSAGGTTVAHGLTWTKIRDVTVLVRNDLDTLLIPLFINTNAVGGWYTVDSTVINLYVTTVSAFDNSGFDATSFNRGWVTIKYVD